MAGFLPVGSFPVASVPGEYGTSYTVTSATITFQGFEPTFAFVPPPTIYGQFTREVLFSNTNPRTYVGQFVREVLRTSLVVTEDQPSVCILW